MTILSTTLPLSREEENTRKKARTGADYLSRAVGLGVDCSKGSIVLQVEGVRRNELVKLLGAGGVGRLLNFEQKVWAVLLDHKQQSIGLVGELEVLEHHQSLV